MKDHSLFIAWEGGVWSGEFAAERSHGFKGGEGNEGLVLVYDYLELYGANAQNTYRRIQKSYCWRLIHTKRFYWPVFLKRIESRTLESHESLVCLVCLICQVCQCLEKHTLVEKSKIWNLKPNCIYSRESIEQHDYRETEGQNSNGCKLLVKLATKHRNGSNL